MIMGGTLFRREILSILSLSLPLAEIVNVVVTSTVKTYATFLVWLSLAFASPSLALSGLR